MSATVKKKKQDLSRASAHTVGEVAVGCVEKHGLLKPISLTSVKFILATAKLVNLERHSETICSYLETAVASGKIEKIANCSYLVNMNICFIIL